MQSKSLAMLSMLAAMAGSAEYPQKFNPSLEPVKPPIPKGHKEFFIEGISIFALNRKNAEKKVAKLKKNQQ